MDSSGFLRSVSFGGFDKKDVLAYVDDLNTKIYTLEAELEDAKKKVGSGKGGHFEGKEEYEQLLAKERAKSSELMAKVDTLNLTIQSNESVIADKDKEIENLKAKIEELENAKPAEQDTTASFDIGSVFIEAKKSADKIVSEARLAVKKMDADAKALAEQVIEEANSKAQSIVSEANEKAEDILRNAENKSAELERMSRDVQVKIKNTIDSMFDNINKISDTISDFSRGSTISLEKAKNIITEAQSSIDSGVKSKSVPKVEIPVKVEAPKYEAPKYEAPKHEEPAVYAKKVPNDGLADLVAQIEAEAL